ncbi:DUF2235 domain-containing protein [uncultured Flavobacterium sp.]|uniref:DUF2235 domain-containing protein n=1 Tax=uncultured Flavobacterium sp. TaxID=165435 RepID=UPI003081F134
MPKKITILFDGTWNNGIEGNCDTNINALKLSISKVNQVQFYYVGVGENIGKVNRAVWGAFGKGVFGAVRKAWEDIANNYEDGDAIYIFGFSRGAFAARHLASMIVRYGTSAYQGRIEDGFREYLANCHKSCENVKKEVHFLGLFDCVPGNYLYLLRNNSFHLNSSKLEKGILHFRHAVSINERRYSFRPILFKKGAQQSFAQHWFPGYHSDVGGNRDNSLGLSSFSLWWMIREVYGLGLNFENIQCPNHFGGNNLGVILNVNPEEQPTSSDYFTTKLGITWERQKREKENLPSEQLGFENLNICPRCGNEMFDYFSTDYGKMRLERMGLRDDI